MADIAKRAGVSRSTASFVLNGREAELRISDRTRQRVLQAASEMGYRRNGLAWAIGSGKNYVFGFVKTGQSEQESRILDGILKESALAGYLVKVLARGHEEHYQEVARHCVEQRLAGLVIRRFAHEAEIQALCDELRDYEIPVIFVDDDLATPGTRYVTSDDELGIRSIVQHLIDLGHRRIAYIAGDSLHKQSALRKQRFARVLQENGIDVSDDMIVNTDHRRDRADELTRQIFANPSNRPTAVLYDGDQLAAVGIRALAKLGLRVPDDVSVAGYGGFSFAELYYPSITTVVQPFEEMGRVAIRHLLSHIESKDKRGRGEPAPIVEPDFTPELLPTRLIPGESTAAPHA